MNIRRLVAIIVIYLIACMGWVILGKTTWFRTFHAGERIGPQVEALWGTPLVQRAPSFSVQIPGTETTRPVMAEKNEITVAVRLDHRKRGLIWYPTYVVRFDGAYTLSNAEATAQKIRFRFDFPAKGATYDDFGLFVDGERRMMPVETDQGVGELVSIPPGKSRTFRITYLTRGLGQWRYVPAPETGRVRNLALTLKTDFTGIDYPVTSLSPMSVEPAEGGTTVVWRAEDLLTDGDMGVVVPEKINPGPLVARITFFAPVCLIFFMVLTATIGIVKGVEIHPMHYLFVAAGFFAFHLLLVYLADQVPVHLAFGLSAAVSVSMVTAYLRAALGPSFPWKIAAAGQLFFLVLFSYSFFLKGTTGLTVAVGSVITLGVLMGVTAKREWNDLFPGLDRRAPGGEGSA